MQFDFGFIRTQQGRQMVWAGLFTGALWEIYWKETKKLQKIWRWNLKFMFESLDKFGHNFIDTWFWFGTIGRPRTFTQTQRFCFCLFVCNDAGLRLCLGSHFHPQQGQQTEQKIKVSASVSWYLVSGLFPHFVFKSDKLWTFFCLLCLHVWDILFARRSLSTSWCRLCSRM